MCPVNSYSRWAPKEPLNAATNGSARHVAGNHAVGEDAAVGGQRRERLALRGDSQADRGIVRTGGRRFANHRQAAVADALGVDFRPTWLGSQERVFALGLRNNVPSASNSAALQPLVPMSSPR